jgi:uncharacterized protein YyaL (SSP411 family)
MMQHFDAAIKLYQYLHNRHWQRNAIIGPDPIGRINWRVTRFVKSYLNWLPRNDTYIYLQGQGYWIRANLSLYELTGDSHHLYLVARSSEFIMKKQLANGAWEHPPIPGRKGFISTVESVWACLGLLYAYKKIGNSEYMDAVLSGYDALVNVIGFRVYKDSLAVNYYAHSKSLVPNVTTMSLWLIAAIFEVTQDDKFLNNADRLIRFIEHSQMDDGELEYALDSRPHFQCYQYNSFQFLDLAYYFEITGDVRILRILDKLATFLVRGVSHSGRCVYDCFRELPEVYYWTSALASALLKANELGIGNYRNSSERAYQYLLSHQRSDGGFDFSSRNYHFLHDVRSYPRYLAMILDHLLTRVRLTHHKTIRPPT